MCKVFLFRFRQGMRRVRQFSKVKTEPLWPRICGGENALVLVDWGDANGQAAMGRDAVARPGALPPVRPAQLRLNRRLQLSHLTGPKLTLQGHRAQLAPGPAPHCMWLGNADCKYLCFQIIFCKQRFPKLYLVKRKWSFAEKKKRKKMAQFFLHPRQKWQKEKLKK